MGFAAIHLVDEIGKLIFQTDPSFEVLRRRFQPVPITGHLPNFTVPLQPDLSA
jgi:hypothetical protein